MTRVTDEDLEWLAGYCDGDSTKAARIVREMRNELLALRKVADAAVKYRDAPDGRRVSVDAFHDLLEILREAGL